MKTFKAIRWTLAKASAELKIHSHTLSKRLKSGSIEPGEDGLFGTMDICRAVYGDMEGEKLRDKRLDADLKEIEKHQALREWIPAALVDRVWSSLAAEIVQKISALEIPPEKKQELAESLQAIPIDEYFATTDSSTEADDEEIPSPATAAPGA